MIKATVIEESIYFGACLRFRGLVHYHPDMAVHTVLEKELRDLIFMSKRDTGLDMGL